MNNNLSRILLVDDDQRNIFALTAVLSSRGFTCTAASDAAGCIHMLKNDPGISIVLLDMMMPGMDGYEAIGYIKSVKGYEQLPVIAVTAQAMDGDRQKCIDAGADGYLSKPIDVDLLLKQLAQYIKV